MENRGIKRKRTPDTDDQNESVEENGSDEESKETLEAEDWEEATIPNADSEPPSKATITIVILMTPELLRQPKNSIMIMMTQELLRQPKIILIQIHLDHRESKTDQRRDQR